MSAQQLDEAIQEKMVDLFDNEAIWDADDTDGYIVHLFEDLEASGADLITLKDQGCNSLLHMTALWNRPKIMEELIRRGASLNEKNKNGHTPLDLAMHWGHFDIGQQLRHYGGKHTCEKERDVAISQRDLVQKQLKNCEAELDHVVETHKRAKQEREQLRIERDRLVILQAQVLDECTELGKQVEEFRSAATSMTKERDALQVQSSQLQNELVCEQTARNNAVHSWKVAEKIIAELQQMLEECREREEEALRLRNEAIQDRDVARERSHEAQLDQGIAKQNQLDCERDRDEAIERLLQGEAEIAHDKEKWRKWIAKAEQERRNIQVEIDRQTEVLRSENAKLEKTVTTFTAENMRQRADLERSQTSLEALEKQVSRQQRELADVTKREAKLDSDANVLVFRIQTQVQEKMIERKGELIQRFTHHRQEKIKQQLPARFRELSVRPML
ncbi:SH3 and multiple ankyrin repeat domains protein [Phytophthora boehmeriae]|uniref:SH3 and multiple ankyrin repeat domains protein n=1 Tax=Phytophthora boehmeriae TaxID=109152 RepID=A0A8T1WIT0_9STRA|nr:SH3 and multiple ankyrin repeat domains protein [Phytophthora boehmeriae]